MSPYNDDQLPHIDHHDSSNNHAYHCWYCGKGFDGRAHQRKPSWDHLEPKTLGGPSVPGNLVKACKGCNEEKGCLTLPLYRMLCALKHMSCRPELFDAPYRHVFYGEQDKPWVNEIVFGDIALPRGVHECV